MDKIKVIRRIMFSMIAIVGILNIVDAIYAAGYVSAESFTAEVTIEPSATVTIDTTPSGGGSTPTPGEVQFNVTPSRSGTFGGTWKSSEVNFPVNVSTNTNSSTEFAVEMVPTSVKLVSGSNEIDTLPDSCNTAHENAGCLPTDDVFKDKWGYSTDGVHYKPVSSSTPLRYIDSDVSFSVFFGAKLTTQTAPGEYTTNVTFTSVTTTPAP